MRRIITTFQRVFSIAAVIFISGASTYCADATDSDSKIPSADTLTEQIKDHPDEPLLYYARAYQYRNVKRFDEAIVDWTKLIQMNYVVPQFNDKGQMIYIERATTYLLMKNYGAAIADLNKALSISPNNPIALSNRGCAYLESKQFPLAMNDFLRALKIAPRSHTAYEGIGEVCYQTHQYLRALDYLNRALTINDKASDAYYYRGATLKAMGRGAEAEKDFRRAEKLGFKLGEPTVFTIDP